ncbi:hypothetical protein Mp_5g21330 [Marchantia polymorpha subsp. ruderalis]|uniref:Uncharacterized protein n=2 Tax=Marchantia polymorpha TaxID=3197 RepID=A0AAF6BKQ7_MARPO|nr:hypothetical protein MARPO_0058s0115 [Marchantia polymorpha]BBN12591.1 hypothetical protein Mp_5g21330 [Marchantia polymorpha subsp. ruderalis]|eukprot:PTQ37351.1 hypothetical protein MARPO_0058s0115 [Marchantia polymorpha]
MQLQFRPFETFQIPLPTPSQRADLWGSGRSHAASLHQGCRAVAGRPERSACGNVKPSGEGVGSELGIRARPHVNRQGGGTRGRFGTKFRGEKAGSGRGARGGADNYQGAEEGDPGGGGGRESGAWRGTGGEDGGSERGGAGGDMIMNEEEGDLTTGAL